MPHLMPTQRVLEKIKSQTLKPSKEKYIFNFGVGCKAKRKL